MFDKRTAMSDRMHFESKPRTTSLPTLLVLAAAVLVAPMQTWGFVTVSSLPDCLHGHFGQAPVQPTIRSSVALATDAVAPEKALPSKEKEQDGESVLDDHRISFVIPSSLRQIADRQLIAPLSILSHFHLRC